MLEDQLELLAQVPSCAASAKDLSCGLLLGLGGEALKGMFHKRNSYENG